MKRLLFLPLLAAVLLMGTSPVGRADDKDNVLADELRLKAAYLPTDGPGLVNFLRVRARGEASKETLTRLIDRLGDESTVVRHKAAGELVAIGPPAIPYLRELSRDVDVPDAAGLARRLLGALEQDSASITSSAIRLLAARRPVGTAQALLAYLPHAENDSVMEEARNALVGVAYYKGKPDPDVLRALADAHPVRRAAAIVALCSSGIAEPRAALRKLLTDPMPSVRLRASLALAQAMDAKAVSTLIALLADLPADQNKEVEGFLTDLAAEQAPKVPTGTDQVSREKARDAWAKWWLDTEGPELLDEVKKRTLTEVDLHKAETLIDKLGDDAFETRQQAEKELKTMGAKIMPLLKQAQRNPDLEVRTRANRILASIEMNKATPLSPVTARLIALRKPKGAVEALLAFMPFAEDEALLEECQTALNMVAYPKGLKAHSAIVKALKDKSAIRRAAAGAALCYGPFTEYLPQIRQLLRDRDNTVRLKTALALAGAKEREAVPVLIELIAMLPSEQSASAEDYLMKLAREAPPKELPDGDEGRKKRSESWAAWWKTNSTTVAMVDRFSPIARQRYLGYTMLVQANNNQITELGTDNKPRWTLSVPNPYDAQYLKGNRILVAEYNTQRVTERDLKGDIKWTVQVPSWPLQAERLRNGHTFIVCRNLLMLVDRAGKQVMKLDRPHDVMTARKLPNGKIMLLTSNRQYLTLTASGKELKSAPIPNVYYNSNEILDNGNVLVPLGWNNRLVEYNPDGKEIWSATVQQPMSAVRLPNGNTAVASQQWPYKIHELDKTGKQINEVQTNTYTYRLKRR
jgi:HEAT repeat protein